MAIHEITLNAVQETIPKRIDMVQGDTGRIIKATILNQDLTDATAAYYIRKPSGHEIYNDAIVDDDTVIINLTQQSLAETGIAKLQLNIYKESKKISTYILYLNISESLADNGTITSSNEFNSLASLVIEAQDTIDDVNAATNQATVAANAANEAAQQANTAAGSANDGAQHANAAANAANEAAQQANAATSSANQAAQQASTAANAANEIANNIQEHLDDRVSKTATETQTIKSNLTLLGDMLLKDKPVADIETGTWSGTSTTGSLRYGQYTRVGNLCYISCTFDVTDSSREEPLKISGLPFPPVDFSCGVFNTGYTNAESYISASKTDFYNTGAIPNLSEGVIGFVSHISGRSWGVGANTVKSGVIMFAGVYSIAQ